MKNIKTTFKQSHRHPRFYALSVLTVLILISYILTGGLRIVITGVLVLDFMFLIPYLTKYQISEEGVLTAGGDVFGVFGKVRIPYVQKLVMQKDRVDIYYMKENCDTISVAIYFPADKQLFVDTLTAINSDIRVI